MQRGLIFFTLFALFFPLTLLSYDSSALSQERYWQQLLHFRDGKSEIDSPDFFLSPKGKTDAKAELDATIAALYHDKAVFCRFPARIKWLYEKLPALSQEVPYQDCQTLEDLIASYRVSQAVLVFPTAHINSPASMFGHTFLRLDNQKGLALTANAVNYAAKTAETNGLVFAYKGLFGGYEGRYSVLPYYKKIKEYNNLERRDIWEYSLNLKPEELQRLLRHLYELRDVYADYYFFTENCSYNLLWLLEIARPGVRLVEQFHLKAIPIDTIRAVKKAGLITDTHFRPSKTREIKALMQEEKKAEGEIKKAYKSELEIELLQLKRTEKKIAKKPYVEALMQLLQKRSKQLTLPKRKIKQPANPLDGHKSARMSLGVGSHQKLLLTAKSAFHDIYDIEKGFISGAYIDFLHLQLSKEKEGAVQLEKLDLLDLHSYSPRNSIFHPLSWAVRVGAERLRGQTYAGVHAEAGVSYALADKVLSFIMIAPSLYYHDSPIAALGPKVGILVNFSDFKCGAIAKEDFLSDGEKNRHAEVFATLSLGHNFALNIKRDMDKIGEKKSETGMDLSLFYYF